MTTLAIVPVVNYMPVDGRSKVATTPRSSSGSNASFYITQDIGGVAYFQVPYPFLGNNINSYGEHLTYKLYYSGDWAINEPDLIIMVTVTNINLRRNSILISCLD